MAKFPYITNSAKVKQFLEHIQKAGVPEKVSRRYLEASGFGGANDRPLIPILKYIGFLDSAGVPTDEWTRYRDKAGAGSVLAMAIRRAYPGLFRTYPKADREDDKTLLDYFAAHTTVAESTRKYMLRTFKALCELADFEEAPPDVAAVEPTELAVPSAQVPSPGIGAVNVVVHLELPATDDPAVYDSLFKALKKHLLS